MRHLYSAFLRPKQSRIATEWHVLTGSHSFYLPPTRPSWLYSLLRKHSPDGTTQTRRHTFNIAYYSIYRPRKDESLSWPSWLTYSGRFTHKRGHPSAVGRAWDRESSSVKDQRSNHCKTQPTKSPTLIIKLLLVHLRVFQLFRCSVTTLGKLLMRIFVARVCFSPSSRHCL